MLCLWEKCECFYYSQSVMQDTEISKKKKYVKGQKLSYSTPELYKKENELKLFNMYMKILHKKITLNETNYKHPPPSQNPLNPSLKRGTNNPFLLLC